MLIALCGGCTVWFVLIARIFNGWDLSLERIEGWFASIYICIYLEYRVTGWCMIGGESLVKKRVNRVRVTVFSKKKEEVYV